MSKEKAKELSRRCVIAAMAMKMTGRHIAASGMALRWAKWMSRQA